MLSENDIIANRIAYKHRLKNFCQQAIEQRMVTAKALMQDAQEAANNEEKSSAGDKYETSRAMGQLQKDMHAKQLNEYMRELASLHTINIERLYNEPVAGAVIETTNLLLFICAGLGRQLFEGKEIFFLSPQAPLATAIKNKKAGDEILVHRQLEMITFIF